MIALSTEYPAQIVQKRQKGYAIIFDIEEIDEGFQYKEVLAASMDAPVLESAVLRHYYSQDDELRIINDYLVNGSSDEWLEYQKTRTKAKLVSEGIISG